MWKLDNTCEQIREHIILFGTTFVCLQFICTPFINGYKQSSLPPLPMYLSPSIYRPFLLPFTIVYYHVQLGPGLLLFLLFLFVRLLRLGLAIGFAFGIGFMPQLPSDFTHSINLAGMFHLALGVCVAKNLPQNVFQCAVDLVSPLHSRIDIGILAWHYIHLLLSLEGHVCLFDLATLFFFHSRIWKVNSPLCLRISNV